MTKRTKKKAGSKAGNMIPTSISLPKEMFDEAMAKRVNGVPEMNFSKYARALVRADLQKA